ncbi:hypothetical protein IM660_12245 [Ruania alkalisoli]|uniref:Uncharacterized protein n=1 Tax=Ruania alkalisoli TaxID=2779775 RepID=A0A7M1SPH7_9MICO|nr:hypothetical protein [Ruania alkalisoli]QOR69459.1 hypothetical protein IM660_12245 [Ruania alkalisoli]
MTDLPRPARPHTATQLLVARGGDPFEQARTGVARARTAVAELLTVLPPEQDELRAAFTSLDASLDLGQERLSGWQLSAAERTTLAGPSLPSWGETSLTTQAPVGTQPPDVLGEVEPVYGFGDALQVVRHDVGRAAEQLPPSHHAPAGGLHRVMLAGFMAETANTAEHLAHVFTAAVWDFERPAMPPVPPALGRIELRPAARAAPQRRWARQARVIFTPGRVEIIHSGGTRVIGETEPIAMVLHVVPPPVRDVLAPYDPAERFARIPGWDELGVLHFCSASGHSLGAIAVADWLVQPKYVIAQERSTAPAGGPLRGRDLLVRTLELGGFGAGVAMLDVPLRRGVLHPPNARPPEGDDRKRSGTQPTGATVRFPEAVPGSMAFNPQPVVDLIRPAPHLQPYRGRAARPAAAFKRRLKRYKRWRGDTGPSSPVNSIVRGPAPWAIGIAGIGGAYLLAETWFVRLCALWAVLAVVEPWAWALLERLRDRRQWRPVAVYRPGASAGVTRAFASRAALLFDGRDVGIRGPGGHEAWCSGPGQTEPGVVALHRLMDDQGTWAVALVGRTGQWRTVLPLDSWVPDGDLTALAGFAREAGLSLSDTRAERVTVSDDVFADGTPSSSARSRGPAGRGLLILAFWAVLIAPLTLWGWRVATAGLLLLAVAAALPVLVRWVWERRMVRPARR